MNEIEVSLKERGIKMYGGFSRKLKKKLNNELHEETSKELEIELKEMNKHFTEKKASWIVLGLFIVILLLVPILLWNSGFTNGQFGDLFNGIAGPVISAGALIAASLAYQSQQKQFRLQRIQLEKDRIENQFFQLLNMHNEIVNSLVYYKIEDLDNSLKERLNNEYRGRAYFRAIYFKLIQYYRQEKAPDKNKYYTIIRKLDNDEQDQLYHYFRNLYQIFYCVYKSRDKLEEDEQKEYIELINAQLTYYEKQLLFFNTKYYGSDGFYKILTHYDFFKDYQENDYTNLVHQFENDADLIYPQKGENGEIRI